MAHYKLVYFNGRGKAEVARLILAAGGQEYEDFRFEREDWPNHKPNMPFGQVPVLEVTEGEQKTVLAQSNALNRFLANRLNLAGSTDLQRARVDMFVDQFNDLLNAFAAFKNETNEERKNQLREKLFAETVPQTVRFVEAALEKNNTSYLTGDELTWADLTLFYGLSFLNEHRDALLENAPLLRALEERVKNLPRVAEWLAKRPVTEF